MKVSVVLSSYIRNDHRVTLDSLLNQSSNKGDYEIIVIKNGSNNHKYLNYENVSIYEVNWSGLSRARNFGIRKSKFEIVAFIDDDAVANRDWIKTIIEAHTKYKEPVIGGKVSPLWPCNKPLWIKGILLDYLSLLDYSKYVTPVHSLDWVAGTNMSIKRIIFKKVGYFDEHVGRKPNSLLSSEEEELFRRIRKVGMNILYSPNIRVQHVIPKSRLEINYFIQRAYWQGISDYIMDKKDLSKEKVDKMISEKIELINNEGLISTKNKSEKVIALCQHANLIGYIQQSISAE